MKPNIRIRSALLVVLPVLLLSIKTSAQEDSLNIPLNIRQSLDKYCITLSQFSQLCYELEIFKDQDQSGMIAGIKNVKSEFESLFYKPFNKPGTCLVANDFISPSDKNNGSLKNPGMSISNYLDTLDQFSRKNKVIYSPDQISYGFTFVTLRIADMVIKSDHTIYQINAKGFLYFEKGADFVKDSIPLSSYFTFISYHTAGLWTLEPKICRITQHQEPIHAFYPYQIYGSGITNTGTVQFTNITDSRKIPFQGANFLLDFHLSSFGNSIVLLNSGIQVERRSFGLTANSYFDSSLKWQTLNGDTLYTSTLFTLSENPVKHNLVYNILSVPINIKVQKEFDQFFCYAYGGVRVGGILNESYSNLSGSVVTTDSIVIAKNDRILQKYSLSNVPDLGLKEYSSPQIPNKSFFKPLSFGYQVGVGGGIKITPKIRVGANIEYNSFFLNPKDISVDPGYIKPINYSPSSFSMSSFHGKIGLYYTFQNATRPFFSVRNYDSIPPVKKTREGFLEVKYDLTALSLDTMRIKKVQYFIQNVNSKEIYQKGFISSKKAGHLKIKTPENASFILIQPTGFELTIKNLPTESNRNLLVLPIPKLKDNPSLEVVAQKLNPSLIFAIYTSADAASPDKFQDAAIRKICESIPNNGLTKKVFVEKFANTFIPAESCKAIESEIRISPEESGSFVDKLNTHLLSEPLFNRKVHLVVFVNTLEAFMLYIRPAILNFQEMRDVKSNMENVTIQVFTDFDPKDLNRQIGSVEKGWNIMQLQ
jgi:hypothetical protein